MASCKVLLAVIGNGLHGSRCMQPFAGETTSNLLFSKVYTGVMYKLGLQHSKGVGR